MFVGRSVDEPAPSPRARRVGGASGSSVFPLRSRLRAAAAAACCSRSNSSASWSNLSNHYRIEEHHVQIIHTGPKFLLSRPLRLPGSDWTFLWAMRRTPRAKRRKQRAMSSGPKPSRLSTVAHSHMHHLSASSMPTMTFDCHVRLYTCRHMAGVQAPVVA